MQVLQGACVDAGKHPFLCPVCLWQTTRVSNFNGISQSEMNSMKENNEASDLPLPFLTFA